MLRIGIDIGGTFTDFVIYNPEDGKISSYKLLTDNSNPANTVLRGLDQFRDQDIDQIIHGSTVATNALLERKGVATALITTKGFKDVLQIGRQNRPNIYDWTMAYPPALIPSSLRYEVDERIDSHGKVVTKLNPAQLEDIYSCLEQNNIESVAVCLLFSFLFPNHEQIIASILREKGLFVSVSSEILPEFREYERTSTTVINAYVSPVLERYLSTLQNHLPSINLQIMQSNGGMVDLTDAKNNGAYCILSGPAGGVIGAKFIAETLFNCEEEIQQGHTTKIITFDMGGTSTDVSLINDVPTLRTDSIVGGYPVHLQMLDIHTIGAGGGSIAYIDPGGLLRVGPESAGANPGPACYGSGTLPTVTDANVVLGRIIPTRFLGGLMKIYPEQSYNAVSELGRLIGLTPIQAAFGIIDIINIQMEKAIRVISVERGFDPREFSLFSFGGAGGLHAIELARQLGIPKVIISKYASTLSALGMLTSNLVNDYVKTVMLPGSIMSGNLDQFLSPLRVKCINDITQQGLSKDKIEILQSLDIRYVGQSFEINIPYTENFLESFHERHKSLYGYSFLDKAIEIVNVRVRGIGKVAPVKFTKIKNNSKKSYPVPVEFSQVEFRGGPKSIPIYDYDELNPGNELFGPAMIISTDTTIFINSDDRVLVDNYLNLLIDIYTRDMP